MSQMSLRAYLTSAQLFHKIVSYRTAQLMVNRIANPHLKHA
ncbi:predicted protein [Botrytis cinerea T4]|uniref:Uncharacterized protein n=1 Tax=Botryotinia fuckeliana (strain T4) TaxID=999810 RepID=G2Y7R7_BOTF4|nr:predicted protein [Botrytis cinerea T4]